MADPRLAAVRHVLAVLDGRSLDSRLAVGPAMSDDRDRALAAELSYGVCRWYSRLDALVARLLRKPFKPRDRDLRVLLLVGTYQLLYSRIPPHAAVSATVAVTRSLGKPWASKLVNGVLRSMQRERAAHEAAVDTQAATRHALPDWLYDRIASAWPDRVEAIAGQLQQRPPMTLRVDLRRMSRAEYARQLDAAGFSARPHPTVVSALELEQPVAVSRLPGFSQGHVSVQDAGAQLAAPWLDLQPDLRVLDACAAPGGKTLHLLQHEPSIKLTALDVDPSRLRRVAENLQRSGLSAELVAADAADPNGHAWATPAYDRILVDAPCSATGVLRRHPDIRLLRRADDVDALVVRQAGLLDALWALLVPGGRLLYVTCSLLPVENAQQVDAFVARQPDARVVALPSPAGTASGYGVQLLPDTDETDGFYYAALQKAVTATP